MIDKVCIESIPAIQDEPEPAMSVKHLYVTVHQAAEILGVAPNTVRKWGAEQKLPEHRHPINGYRLYKRDDLEAVLRAIERSVTPHAKRISRARSR